MKKLLFSALILLIPTLLFAAGAMKLPISVSGTGGAGLTYVYPNSITSFPTATTSVGSGVALGDTISGVTQTITKLGMYISAPQSATECSVGIFDNATGPSKYSGADCHFAPATGTWGECTISYGMSSGTTYTIWGGCDADYKILMSQTQDCTAYYSVTPYVPHLADILGNRVANGVNTCFGLRMGY